MAQNATSSRQRPAAPPEAQSATNGIPPPSEPCRSTFRSLEFVDAAPGSHAAGRLKRLYPPNLELLQAQIMVRHGERTPLVHSIVGPGMPRQWPLCKDQRPTATQQRGEPYSDRELVNPETREVETLRLEGWLETPTGSDGMLSHARDANSSLPVPLSPNPSSKDGPGVESFCKTGMLTDVGRKSAFEFGVRLRKLYVDRLGLLPGSLDGGGGGSGDGDAGALESPLYLRSSPFSRTIETVLHAYQGLYPAGTRGTEPQILFRRDGRKENLFPSFHNCPRLGQIYKKFKESTAALMEISGAVHNLDQALDPILPSVLLNSGIPPETAVRPRVGLHANSLDPTRVMDMIHTVEAHQHAWSALYLLDELHDCHLQKVVEAMTAKHWFAQYRSSVEARGLAAGPLLRDMTERMVQRVQGRGAGASTRLGMYGCHDTSIGSMVVSLGAEDGRWPPFTSTVVFELFRKREEDGKDAKDTKDAKDDGKPTQQRGVERPIGRRKMQDLRLWEQEQLDGHYVRVMYNNHRLTIPHCAKDGNHLEGKPYMCTLRAFKTLVDEMAPDNIRQACEIDPREPAWAPSRSAKQAIDAVGRSDGE